MVKNFTREDIPILGRLVSISEDNTVANAEQIWDSKRKTNQSDINQSVENRITNIETQGGLSQEYKNILDYLLLSTNFAEYNTGDWNAEPELFYYPVSFKGEVDFNRIVEINKDEYSINDAEGQWYALQVIGVYPNTDNKALFVNGKSDFFGIVNIDGNENPNALYVSNGNGWFDQDLHVDGDLTVAGDIRYIGGDTTFSGNIKIDDTDNILLLNEDLTLSQIINDIDKVEVWECNSSGVNVYIDHTYGEIQEIINQKKILKLYVNNGTFNSIFTLHNSNSYCYFLNNQVNRKSPESTSLDCIYAQYIDISSFDDQDQLLGSLPIVTVKAGDTTINAGTGIYIDSDPYQNDYNISISSRFFNDNDFTIIGSYDRQLNLSQEYKNLPTSKQDTLVSGENIKTINGESLLGSGNITITGTGGGGGNVVDNNYVHTDNNYTTAEKNKLANIEDGAQVNVQSDWTESDTESDAYIQNKPTKLSEFTNDTGFITLGDISTVGGITAEDIAYWNAKSDTYTTLSGYGVIYDTRYFTESQDRGFTLTDDFILNHPTRMTQLEGEDSSEWSSNGDNKVPTVGAVYNKFISKDDDTVVKTTGNQSIAGIKSFSSSPVVPGIKASGTNQSGVKLFTTNGSISTLKTINGNSLFGSGDISIAYSNFTSPTSSAAGTAGLVPAPAANTNNYILSADGWEDPSNLGFATTEYVDNAVNSSSTGGRLKLYVRFPETGFESFVRDKMLNTGSNNVQHVVTPMYLTYYKTPNITSDSPSSVRFYTSADDVSQPLFATSLCTTFADTYVGKDVDFEFPQIPNFEVYKSYIGKYNKDVVLYIRNKVNTESVDYVMRITNDASNTKLTMCMLDQSCPNNIIISSLDTQSDATKFFVNGTAPNTDYDCASVLDSFEDLMLSTGLRTNFIYQYIDDPASPKNNYFMYDATGVNRIYSGIIFNIKTNNGYKTGRSDHSVVDKSLFLNLKIQSSNIYFNHVAGTPR